MSLNLSRERKRAQSASHLRAPKMERETAKRIKGAITAGSGSGAVRGDVRLKRVARIECKTTRHASFSVTAEIIAKLEAAVVGAGEVPVLQVEILSGAKRVLVMPDWALEMLLDAVRSED